MYGPFSEREAVPPQVAHGDGDVHSSEEGRGNAELEAF
jgi:hypothetical protein